MALAARLFDHRSDWPEYGVKVISTSKIIEMGYEASVSREIAVLRLLSHPNIARMVSAFRWRDGAYLVLEYASRGDLHSHIVQNGSLDEPSTRFVVGEVIAALRSVHDAGLVYGDLKPENVVITESGHVKLTDFGACRAGTEAAKALLRASRHNVRKLRDGDWDAVTPTAVVGGEEEEEEDEGGDAMEEEEDERIEGTLAYMPPEVIQDGQIPDTLADSWALGCLLFQCVVGRPPVFTELDDNIKARVVSFAASRDEGLSPLLTNHSLSQDIKDLIQGLLMPDKTRRFTLEAAAVHPFFTSQGVNVDALHRG